MGMPYRETCHLQETFNDGTACLYNEENERHRCEPDTKGFEAL